MTLYCLFLPHSSSSFLYTSFPTVPECPSPNRECASADLPSRCRRVSDDIDLRSAMSVLGQEVCSEQRCRSFCFYVRAHALLSRVCIPASVKRGNNTRPLGTRDLRAYPFLVFRPAPLHTMRWQKLYGNPHKPKVRVVSRDCKVKRSQLNSEHLHLPKAKRE
ncbi:hypothetical protein J6590_050854 [Homalodisca vitripennis]|nr:hypothetical protein J6590_050854 [Homalodisca vitripennis]